MAVLVYGMNIVCTVLLDSSIACQVNEMGLTFSYMQLVASVS